MNTILNDLFIKILMWVYVKCKNYKQYEFMYI